MEAVALPRVVPEHDVGPRATDHLAHGGAVRLPLVELTVDDAEERDVHRPERVRGGSLLLLARRDEVDRVALPGPLRPVRQHEQVDLGAGIGPLRERRSTPELDVVRVCPDRERAPRDVEIDGHARAASTARSSGTSTSNPSCGSRTTRTARPSERAAAT